MKKTLCTLFVCLLSITLIGCGLKPIHRGFQDNVFYSSAQPIMVLQMSPDFRYVKNKASSRMGFHEGSVMGKKGIVTEALYVFVDQADSRSIVISLKHIGTSDLAFKPRLWPIKDAFDSGRVEVLGFSYQYCTYAITHASSTYLVKGYGRLVGPLNNNILLVHYVERQEDV